MNDSFDLVVVGGGIVGVATAAAAQSEGKGRRVLLLEKEPELAQHQTGRNSNVLHSGLYYKPGSAKARLCVQGATSMLQFCQDEKIRHDVCGKLVVATEQEELPRMAELLRRGRENGVPGLVELDTAGLRVLEPEIAGIAGLKVPSTAIVDYPAIVTRMAERFEAAGGTIRCGVEVQRIADDGQKGATVHSSQGEIQTAAVIACAGLWSDRLAKNSGVKLDLRIVPFRGEYWELRPERAGLVGSMIYPVPDPRFPFLGVHLTPDLEGGIHCGPNAVLTWRRDGYQRGDFKFGDAMSTIGWPGFWKMAARHAKTGLAESWRAWSKHHFAQALRRLAPSIEDDDLLPAKSGVRAQALARDGALCDDFAIETEGRVLHVLNAPSPAATASLSIADELLERAKSAGLLN